MLLRLQKMLAKATSGTKSAKSAHLGTQVRLGYSITLPSSRGAMKEMLPK